MNIVEPIKDKTKLKRVEHLLSKGNWRNLLLFVMGINTGLRVSDILALNVRDVKHKDYVSIIEKKTGKRKSFPLNEKVQDIVKYVTYRKKMTEPLFRTSHKKRMDRTNAYRIINQACRDAGIETCIGTHTLRKTFGYHHYKQFKDVVILQKIFNHSSPQITLRYIGVEQDEIDKSYLNFTL